MTGSKYSYTYTCTFASILFVSQNLSQNLAKNYISNKLEERSTSIRSSLENTKIKIISARDKYHYFSMTKSTSCSSDVLDNVLIPKSLTIFRILLGHFLKCRRPKSLTHWFPNFLITKPKRSQFLPFLPFIAILFSAIAPCSGHCCSILYDRNIVENSFILGWVFFISPTKPILKIWVIWSH